MEFDSSEEYVSETEFETESETEFETESETEFGTESESELETESEPEYETVSVSERAEDALARIRETLEEDTVPAPFRSYFLRVGEFLLSVTTYAENRSLYADILPDHYARSYANPDYAAEKLGPDYGPLLSAVYAELRGIIPAVFEGNDEFRAMYYELFLELYFEFENEELPEPETVRSIFGSFLRDYMPRFAEERIRGLVVPENNFAADIIEYADLSDEGYLFSYGEYISEDTKETARFMASLPEETVEKMARTFTEGYRLGFVHGGKDLSKKKTVQIIYELGFERMIRAAIRNFREMGLKPTILRTSVNLVTKSSNRHAGYTGAIPNMQFDYDHREDLKLVLDRRYVSARKRAQQELFEKYRDEARGHAGPAVLETFGETPFEPHPAEHMIRMTDEENRMLIDMRSQLVGIQLRYIPMTERSFTIIDFPVPAIGRDFEHIFNDTVRVNTLDSEVYGRIQQKLIDALDQGVRVHVTGRGKNRTDITVALHPLTDPSRETIFENCVADVNIPVGEVFTSPRLAGTNGTLHVSHVFLNGYEFRDLEITVKDGFVDHATCGNFESEAENQNYISENILFRHPTLTVGEFAIGTNTTAYVMGRKYGIESLLPILIAEKTGPHFAFGDTCYSHEEDNPVFNPDGKEIVARDNEHTLSLRKTDPAKAYYNCHTDVTIPYDELGEIRVIRADGGGITLIRDGRFVLPGTEELNKPLEKM